MLGLLAVQTKVLLSEVPDPGAKRLRVEIVAATGSPDRKEWAALEALRSTLTAGTRTYTRFQLLEYATLAGDPIRVTLAADHLRIGFSVPPSDVNLATDLASELMRDALLGAEEVQEAIDNLPFRRRSVWTEAWLPFAIEPKGITQADVAAIYRKVFSPGNVSIALGGAVAPGSSARLGEKFASWVAKPEGRRRYPDPPSGPLTSRTATATTVSIEGPEVSAVPKVTSQGAESELPSALLAVSMLGQGKGATAYRVLRTSKGWSYRQEAFLRGSPGGLVPVVAFGTTSQSPNLAEDAREELMGSVEKWTEQDRIRAIAFNKANQDLNLGMGTLYFAESRPLDEGIDDRTFLAAYWKLKTGRPWDANAIRSATLEQAKQAARKWLKDGTIRVIRGAGGVPGG